MRTKITILTISLLFGQISAAQRLFVGPLRFKGHSDGERFIGRGFEIDRDGPNFEILLRPKIGEPRSFSLEFNRNSIRDVVCSSRCSAVAVATDASEWRSSQMALVTVDVAGKKRAFYYKYRKLTDRFGWIVELGAVSDDGTLVLAKCARMQPADESGVAFVQHEWVVLRVSNGSLEIVPSEAAIDEWSKHVSKAAGVEH